MLLGKKILEIDEISLVTVVDTCVFTCPFILYFNFLVCFSNRMLIFIWETVPFHLKIIIKYGLLLIEGWSLTQLNQSDSFLRNACLRWPDDGQSVVFLPDCHNAQKRAVIISCSLISQFQLPFDRFLVFEPKYHFNKLFLLF